MYDPANEKRALGKCPRLFTMTQECIEKEMAKAGWRSFKCYLWVIYHVGYKTLTNWSKEEQEYASKDLFSE